MQLLTIKISCNWNENCGIGVAYHNHTCIASLAFLFVCFLHTSLCEPVWEISKNAILASEDSKLAKFEIGSILINESLHKLINSLRHTYLLIFNDGLCFIRDTKIPRIEFELQRKYGISINLKKGLIPYKRYSIWLIEPAAHVCYHEELTLPMIQGCRVVTKTNFNCLAHSTSAMSLVSHVCASPLGKFSHATEGISVFVRYTSQMCRQMRESWIQTSIMDSSFKSSTANSQSPGEDVRLIIHFWAFSVGTVHLSTGRIRNFTQVTQKPRLITRCPWIIFG